MSEARKIITGILYIISAPSGAGKTSLVNALITEVEKLHISISHTTRTKRSHETDTKDYYFVDEPTFQKMRDSGQFLESAEVFGNLYGTSKQWVLEQLQQGTDVLLEIDWQGAQQIRESFPEAVSIFILPPAMSTLEQRLVRRDTDDSAVIQKRLQKACNEINHYDEYDYLIVNDEFKLAVKQLTSIILANRLKLKMQQQQLEPLIGTLTGRSAQG